MVSSVGVDFEEAGEKWRAGDAAKVGPVNRFHAALLTCPSLPASSSEPLTPMMKP
jgi:hypothetical protein